MRVLERDQVIGMLVLMDMMENDNTSIMGHNTPSHRDERADTRTNCSIYDVGYTLMCSYSVHDVAYTFMFRLHHESNSWLADRPAHHDEVWGNGMPHHNG